MNFGQALFSLVKNVFKAPPPPPKMMSSLPPVKQSSIKAVTQPTKTAGPQPNFSPSTTSGQSSTTTTTASRPSDVPSNPPPTLPSQNQGETQSQEQVSIQMPTPAPASEVAIRPPSAATTTPGTLGGATGIGKAAVTGPTSAIPGQNVSLGIKGLAPDLGMGTVKGASATMAPKLPPVAPSSVAAARSGLQSDLLQPAAMAKIIGDTGANAPQAPVGHRGSWLGLPDFNLTEKAQELITGRAAGIEGSNLSSIPGIPGLDTGGTSASKASASFDPSKIGTKEALTDRNNRPTTMATKENLGANITDPTLVEHAITQAVQDPSKAQTVISRIASPEAQKSIVKMMSKAEKTGDMNTVRKLADMHDGIGRQLALIEQIGRAVLAQAKGFGTENAPGVTEARMPMVEQGVGTALTSPQMPQPNFNTPMQSPSAQMMAPRLPVAPVEQNRPVLYPWTGR